MKNEIVLPSVINSSIKIFDSPIVSPKDVTCEWHFHDEFEFFLLYEGKKVFYTENHTYELEAGDIVFVNRRVSHKTLTPLGSRGILIQFNNDFAFEESTMDKYVLTLLKNKETDIVFFAAGTPINMQLCESIKKISKEYADRQKFHNLYIKAYVFEILACLYRNEILVSPDKFMDKKAVSAVLPVLQYIGEHYFEPITLDDISRLVYSEKSYFCKIFKKATKTSFLNYLNMVRIYHAEILLRETKKSVAEIAVETGFSSASYFAETFKKINLLSPMAYRKMMSRDNL